VAGDGAGDAGETVRAFFAVGLDAPLRDEAQGATDVLRARIDEAPGPRPDVRWTRVGGRHVTLRFLGPCTASRLGDLIAGARRALVAIAPFELRLAGLLALPPGRPRVLALDLTPQEPLAAIADALERIAVACGFEAERRAFRPHVTLGRIRRGRLAPRQIEDVAAVVETGRNAQVVRDVALLRSELRRSGARYTVLERVALGTNDHP
jgi:2'-5' RNA ligase